ALRPRLDEQHQPATSAIIFAPRAKALSKLSKITVAPPPLGTKPSRFASKGRQAFAGSFSRGEKTPKPSKLAIPYLLISCAPPQITKSCKPFLIIIYPKPIACDPLAQAALMVILMPVMLNMVDKFMVTVEFIDLKMAPEPIKAVSFFSRTISVASIMALETLSFP